MSRITTRSRDLRDRALDQLGRVPSSNGTRSYTRTLWRRVWTDVELAVIYEPRDLWSGFYWDKRTQSIAPTIWKKIAKGAHGYPGERRDTLPVTIAVYALYRSLLPMLVLRLRWHDKRAVRRWIARHGWRMGDDKTGL